MESWPLAVAVSALSPRGLSWYWMILLCSGACGEMPSTF